MTRTALFRADVIDALAELLAGTARSDGAGEVQVLAHEPALLALDDECVWFGDTTGELSVPFMVAGRKVLDDTFTVDVWFGVASPAADGATARHRAEVLANAVCSALQDDPSLTNLEGVLHCTPAGSYRLLAPGQRDDGEGFGCAGMVTVAVRTRIQ